MSEPTIPHRVIEVKLYLRPEQTQILAGWMRTCAKIYNLALENRIKRYKRRGESASLYDQGKLLTQWRSRIPEFAEVPAIFGRDPLRRLDNSFAAFFRRVKLGQKAGFPRFKRQDRWRCMQYLDCANYVRPGGFLAIPKLGHVKFRGGDQIIPPEQKAFRIIRKASGWYAHFVVSGMYPTKKVTIKTAVGIDVGLEHFATLSVGEHISNPRFLKQAADRLNRAQSVLGRKKEGGNNWGKAVTAVATITEKIASQRRNFAHQLSRRLVNQFDLIAYEKLNIEGLATGFLAESIRDAAWGIFLKQLSYKAVSAGKYAVEVDARGTSQECPDCGRIKKKELSERTHSCECGCVCQRDHASSRVIVARALRVVGASVEGLTTTLPLITAGQAGPMKQ